MIKGKSAHYVSELVLSTAQCLCHLIITIIQDRYCYCPLFRLGDQDT
jgi:hypothetical protein